ncbi:MAG: ABC transporter permease [Holophagales bacterium]|nr:ABC transporter permease [Holophagales bacterium]
MKVLASNVEEVFREAAARWTLVAYATLSTLFIALFAAAVNLDVVDGALAGAKLFGKELEIGRRTVDLDKLVLGFESGFSGFLYVVATFLAVFATAHLVPRLQEKGTIDLYLSRPVGRVPLLLSRYAGGLLLAGLNVAYLIGAMGLLIWWKTGVVHPRFFLGGAIIFFTIATLMAFAFLVGVVTSSTAVSIMATFAVLPGGHPLRAPGRSRRRSPRSGRPRSFGASTGCSRRPGSSRRRRSTSFRTASSRVAPARSTTSPSSAPPRSSASVPSRFPRFSSGERTSDMRRLALLALVTALAFPSEAARPTDDALALVPPDSVTAGMLRVADFRTSPLAARFFAEFDRATVEGDAARFLAEARLHPIDDVDLVVFAAEDGAKGKALVAFEGRFEPQRLQRPSRLPVAPRRVRLPAGRTSSGREKGENGPQGRRRGRVREQPSSRRRLRGRRREGARRPGRGRDRLPRGRRPRRAARQGECQRLRLAPRRPDEAPAGEGLADDHER